VTAKGHFDPFQTPLSTLIARRLDLRLMLAIGFGLFAFSMYLTATLTNQTGFWELFPPFRSRPDALAERRW
jgi:MFS transporter, DHA2 family, multidrug resistance protein